MDLVLVYQHVPKCGGTAFREGCERMFPVRHELFEEGDPPTPDLQEGSGVRMVTGHYISEGRYPWERFGAAMDSPNVKLLTVLREPLARALSAYHFRLQRGIKTAPLKRYLEKRSNPVARFLGFRGNVEAWTRSMYFIGINEALQDSIDLLAAMVGTPAVSLERVNVTRKSQETEISEETVQIFRENNRLDCELYEAGRAFFEAQCREKLGRAPSFSDNRGPLPAGGGRPASA